MTFKLSHVGAAIAITCIASSAFADPTSPNRAPGNYTSGTTDIYVAGSSAVDLALEKFIANSCNDTTLDSYRTDTGGKTYYLWTCETSNNAAIANFVLASGNTKIAIHKNTNSSTDGTVAVANATPLAFMQVSDLNTTSAQCAVSPTVVPASSTIPQYNRFNCGATVTIASLSAPTIAPRFGFSDSEPKQFNSGAAGLLNSSYPLTIVFGIPVTTNVRNALQASQGLTAGDETEAGMPSLTGYQINNIYTGTYTSWANLGINVGADNAIYLIRRSGGSGTTRAFDATFMKDICVPGLTGITAATTLVTSTIATQCNSLANGGAQKLQAGTSDDVQSCLNSYSANGNVGAIGYLSTDYTPAAADGYRWVKVDGYSPKLLNVVDGKWLDWSEESFNYAKATALAGDDLSFFNTVKATSANATLLTQIAQNLAQTTSGQWTGGVLGALPGRQNLASFGLAAGASLTLPRTDASVLAYPANPATHATSAGYNLCSVPSQAAGYVAH